MYTPPKSDTIEEYIEKYTSPVHDRLMQIRQIIKETAPEAIEKISYQMPAFFQNGVLVYYAAAKNHIGFYPTPSGIKAFEEEFKTLKLKYSKGAVQFPIEQKLPEDLIRRIVAFRIRENQKEFF